MANCIAELRREKKMTLREFASEIAVSENSGCLMRAKKAVGKDGLESRQQGE